MAPSRAMVGGNAPSAADVPTLLGTGSFSLLGCTRNEVNMQVKPLPAYLRWPHMQADQVRGISLREIGGGFPKHHRAPSIRFASYAIAKPSTMVQKMQNIKKLRGHRAAVYCAIFDRAGRYVITGSDDRLVKIWSMETAFCLASCRGHEGDITDLAVSSNNALVASASNDYSIRVWRLPDGVPISILRGHVGAVTAIAFSPRHNSVYHLLSSSDDGSCRIWDARCSRRSIRIYLPRQTDAAAGNGSGPSSRVGPSSSNTLQNHQILCCAYNANGTVFVTGSSDTFARVWSACKSSIDDSEQPNHEIDVLAGHENDVNYVQFSGCAVASRSLTSDSITDEKFPKFKNSWFSHDNIVTCSRDGSAIIWIPRSRRSHGKVGRWTRAYHLKVPPPPMPPRPPRGGPRQRFLPTPRGVNMIVWSLDNRFVLAAIMDCRICVWNASDGSLVHSLTGHGESTYVLDVHPFNPRIAMSAGYDGKTIIWDIWEGKPIRTYEIGRFKLVDGKFSPDGTSIVLSDDVGQIYLLNTGQGESQKDSKYDQFFLGDYRPLVRDTHGNVVDQETQLAPHRRNIQDPLCDSSMLPYPEPYQSMYQRRRLGALNLEWHPPSIKFAIGTDIGLGQEYQIFPLADLDVVFEPPPEFIEAMYWEPENDAANDTTDSEYNVAEEYSTEDERGSLSNSSSDPESAGESNNVEGSYRDSRRRSKRKKSKAEDELTTSSGRRIKRRNLNEHDGSSSRSKRTTKSRNGRNNLKRKPSHGKSLRPQRVAALNTKNFLSRTQRTPFNGEDEDSSEDDLSGSEILPDDSCTQNEESDVELKQSRGAQSSLNKIVEAVRPPRHPESFTNTENRKRLVLKFSIRDSKKSRPSENPRDQCDIQADFSSSSRLSKEGPNHNFFNLSYGEPGPSSENVIKVKLSENIEGLHEVENHLEAKQDLMLMDSDLVTKTDGDAVIDHSAEVKDKPRPKPTILRIKTRKSFSDSKSPSTITLVSDVDVPTSDVADLAPEMPSGLEENLVPTVPEVGEWCEDKNHYNETEVEFPEAATDAVRRTRSLKLKATSRESIDMNQYVTGRKFVGTSRSAEKSSKQTINDPQSYESVSRSVRHNGDGFYNNDRRASAGRKSDIAPRKTNWLLLSEQEEGYRYIPQLGDEIAYLRQGHQEYIESCCLSVCGPWISFRERIRDVEICLVEGLDYATLPGSGESCCKVALKFIDPASSVLGQTFNLTLPELIDFPDFVVERTRYDAAIEKNWRTRDKCWVWWRDEREEGGNWWEGQILSTEDKSDEFPGSPWERFLVKYENDDEAFRRHSPWELHDKDSEWEQPQIHVETRNKLLSYFAKLQQAASRNQDKYGILKLKQAAEKLDFINRFPVPLTFEIIEHRLVNNYYRSLEALTHDITVMISNFQTYYAKHVELSAKMSRLSDWFDRTLSKF